MSCIISATKSSSQIENTVFIVIQKLLAASQVSRIEEGSIDSDIIPLFLYSNSSTVFNCYSLNYNRQNVYDNKNNLLRTKYSPGTVGCFLSGHLLLRNDLILNSSDFRAVLTWLGRAFDCFSDISIAHYLDILWSCLHVTRGTLLSATTATELLRNNKIVTNNVPDSNTNLYEEEKNKMNFLITAATTCLSKIFMYQSLALSTSDHKNSNKIQMETSYVIEIFGRKVPQYRYKNRSQDFSTSLLPSLPLLPSPLIWNITSLSSNLMSISLSNRDCLDEKLSLIEIYKNDINVAITSVFWVFQRSAALHSLLSSICDNNSEQIHGSNLPNDLNISGQNTIRSSNLNSLFSDGVSTSAYDSKVSVFVLLSKSELDVSEKIPWMYDSRDINEVVKEKAKRNESNNNNAVCNLEGQRQAHEEGWSREGSIRKQPTSTSTTTRSSLRIPSSEKRNEKTDSCNSTDSRSTAYLHVWSCSAADGIESLSFIRPVNLTVFDCMRYGLRSNHSLSYILTENSLF